MKLLIYYDNIINVFPLTSFTLFTAVVTQSD